MGDPHSLDRLQRVFGVIRSVGYCTPCGVIAVGRLWMRPHGLRCFSSDSSTSDTSRAVIDAIRSAIGGEGLPDFIRDSDTIEEGEMT